MCLFGLGMLAKVSNIKDKFTCYLLPVWGLHGYEWVGGLKLWECY